MKARRRAIPQFDLSPAAKAGVLVWPIQDRAALPTEHPVSEPHRDSHYLLLFTTNGQCAFSLDGEVISAAGPTLFLIRPGQVHHVLTVSGLQGWAVSFEASSLDRELQHWLETALRTPRPLDQQAAYYAQALGLLQVFGSVQATSPASQHGRTTQALLTALLSLLAGGLPVPAQSLHGQQSRSAVLEQAFQHLLSQHYASWKQPAQYAAALAISATHLNDVVKELTGLPVSVHIQHCAVREAKRLLCYTELSVKEVGYAVGYEEPVHFSRLFRKVAGCTPRYFRHQFRA